MTIMRARCAHATPRHQNSKLHEQENQRPRRPDGRRAARFGAGGKTQDAPFTGEQEARVEEIIRAHLLEHPETITKAMQALRQRQAAEEAARVAQALQERRAELLEDPISPVDGNPEGKESPTLADSSCLAAA